MFNGILKYIMAQSTEKLQTKGFKFVFDGQVEQLDIDIVIGSLINISRAIQEINSELKISKKVDIKIKSIEPGSFILDFQLGIIPIIMLTQQLGIIQYISTLADCICIKDFLGSLLKPKEVSKADSKGNIILTHSNGNTITVPQVTYNIYANNVIIRGAISKTFEMIDSDSSIDTVTIKDGDKTVFETKKERFKELAAPVEMVDKTIKTKTDKDAVLHINNLDLQGETQWQFVYLGNRIKARITDKNYKDKVKMGMEGFRNGDKLRCTLLINSRYDISAATDTIVSYEVVQVNEHIKRPEQDDMFETKKKNPQE